MSATDSEKRQCKFTCNCLFLLDGIGMQTTAKETRRVFELNACMALIACISIFLILYFWSIEKKIVPIPKNQYKKAIFLTYWAYEGKFAFQVLKKRKMSTWRVYFFV